MVALLGEASQTPVAILCRSVIRDRQKILRDLLSCGWRRLMFRMAGEDILVPPLKNQKTTEPLRRTAMKFRPLHDRVVIKRIEAEEKSSGGIIIPRVGVFDPSEKK